MLVSFETFSSNHPDTFPRQNVVAKMNGAKTIVTPFVAMILILPPYDLWPSLKTQKSLENK